MTGGAVRRGDFDSKPAGGGDASQIEDWPFWPADNQATKCPHRSGRRDGSTDGYPDGGGSAGATSAVGSRCAATAQATDERAWCWRSMRRMDVCVTRRTRPISR